ncbi:NAD(P)-dependent oxidoreductase [Rhodoplanes sp. TEM]|uniref:NAD(P)-dependent oxidoreductase n=1 Tax=Rhodoplanes tepidamans TaxID=200616 RepID=A0ABT5JFF1_RHOTP|nr:MULTISPECIES: NAD(P)-dependent oxidoreductase [Rhodoplanes]MDC7788445.1 NAD(P)-dependent oxidoreductase [Rhodoplanes tepidamans]MDC7983590.1 NAD(P)-dependent oxidoreductase [Rhodoplanes sp. TEM]MDQ0354168.1 phosphonate dehydrogenase [Rhodoplanes tepidamans]
MSLPRVVITNQPFPETVALLAPHAQLDVNGSPEPWTPEEVRDRCREATGLLAFMTDRIDAGFLDACPSLRVIGAALKGYDNIDVAAAAARGVTVTIVPDLLTVPTAELAIGLMLALGRHIVAGDRDIRRNGFSGWRPRLYGAGLAGATVGILGFGKVGQAIAARLVPFGCRLLAHDASVTTIAPPLDAAVTLAGRDMLLRDSDVVVLALPLTADTLHLIDAAALARMKPSAHLVNPARGSLVDEAAVADALAAGRLAGYAADVFECEDWARRDRPAAIEPRLAAPDAPTVLTPHIGSAVTELRREIERSAAESILDVLQGRPPVHAVTLRETMPC